MLRLAQVSADSEDSLNPECAAKQMPLGCIKCEVVFGIYAYLREP